MIHRHSLPIIVWLFLTGCEGSVIDAERDLYRDTTDVSGTVNYTQDREPCADRHPLRHLYFGDLHAHTALSFDVYAYGVRVDGDGAFAFARGEPVRLPPLDADGIGTREATIDTPLDFAAITDHQEFIAEVDLCATPGNGAYLTDICARLRAGGDDVAMDFGLQLAKEHPLRMADICAAPGVDCDLAARDVWASIVQTARAHDDTTAACSFTAFAAYEYTSSMPALANNHRNVIFRNDDVPSLPPSFFEAPTEEDLWSQLRERCALAGGLCDAIVIPHNTNWSNGNMFLPDLSQGSLEEQVEAARDRKSVV